MGRFASASIQIYVPSTSVVAHCRAERQGLRLPIASSAQPNKPMSAQINEQLTQNLQTIRERIAAACIRTGRSVDEVTLVAVTKYAELDWVQELVKLGVTELGEARPQQLIARSKQLGEQVHWHLIGHLQRNKADDIVSVAHLIHSVDSVRLFEQLVRSSEKWGHRARILLEVNVSGEASKDGFDPDSLLAAWPTMQTCELIEICGLMTMAPRDDHPDAARPVFRRLRELRERLKADCGNRHPLDQLSMGMSGDFEVGIEEGATIVRIGSSLFQGLAASA